MKFLKILIFVTVFFGAVYFITPSRKQALCNENANYLKSSFNGIVVKKFIDDKEHSFPFLYIKNFNDGSITKLDLFDDAQNTYDLVNLKDTLIKLANDPWIYKITNHKKAQLKLINFGCNQ